MDVTKREINAATANVSSLLTRYSKLASQVTTSYSSSGKLADDTNVRRDELEDEVNAALDNFEGLVEKLANQQATAHPPPPASAVRALERHREVHQEYVRDFQRIKANLRQAEQRANLLGSVREEINAFKQSSAADSLLAERGKIDNSNRMADDLLGQQRQAYETRAQFRQQQTNLAGIGARINNVAAGIPGINSIIGMINSRRRRDSVILSTVVGVCVLLLLFFIFG